MVIREELLSIWERVQAHLPLDFDLERVARERRAFLRKREVKDVASLFRLCMAYGGCGMSLRETCAWAEALKVASLSEPSLMERLCKAAPWLGDIVAALIVRQATMPAKRWIGYRLRAIDATALCQPGADRTTWRLHVGFDLASGQVDQLALTDGRGGENLQRLTYQPGEIVLGDRIYARAQNLHGVKRDGADFIVRTGWNSLRLKGADGGEFDLLPCCALKRGRKARSAFGLTKVQQRGTSSNCALSSGARHLNRRKPNRNACCKTPGNAVPRSIHAVSKLPTTSCW
jgi:hypothetical protein